MASFCCDVGVGVCSVDSPLCSDVRVVGSLVLDVLVVCWSSVCCDVVVAECDFCWSVSSEEGSAMDSSVMNVAAVMLPEAGWVSSVVVACSSSVCSLAVYFGCSAEACALLPGVA